MSNLVKVVRVLGVLVLAGGVGIFIGWMKSRDGDIQPVAVPADSNRPAINIAPVAMTEAEPPPSNRPPRITRPKPAPPMPPPGSAEWERQLDDVLLADIDPNAKADRILAMIPTAPSKEAQVELTQHLVNMVQDDHYDGAAQLLTNSTTPAAVSTVLMNDLLNRNNTLKLPMLLDVASDGDHPLKDQARDMLELLIQEDDGTNWDQWAASISTWLQNNPQ
ncbi:MAG TPA: hypothetical protein VGR14_14235 [Verrucomicrobiae bacterium]|jgi:hypothetical protein|nr:hypothetical protein [Verrucomicrobiae bacterium]